MPLKDLLPPVMMEVVNPDHAISGRSNWLPDELETRIRLATSAMLALGYFAFIQFFGVSGFNGSDEWNFLNYYDAFTNGTLHFSTLWTPAADIHRVLLPNLIYLFDAKFNHLDTKAVMLFSALCYVLAFFGVLKAFSTAYSIKLPILVVLLAGFTWFSLINYQIALWGAGVGNYLIVFFLVGLLFLFAHEKLSFLTFSGSAVLATLGTCTLFTGLILWPIGLLCLLWRNWKFGISRLWIFSWLFLGSLAFYFYFLGLNFGKMAPKVGVGNAVSPISAILYYPVDFFKFLAILASGVFPPLNSSFDTSYVRLAVGSLLLFVFIAVVITDLFVSRNMKRIPVISCMILFGLICDLETAAGRMYQGIQFALSSRYALPNILAIVGSIFFMCSLFVDRAVKNDQESGVRVRIYVVAVLAVLFCSIQISTSFIFGVDQARQSKSDMEMSNRTFANLDKISDGNQRFALLIRYGSPFPTDWGRLVPIAQKNQLGVFYPSQFNIYRELGPPPRIPDVQFRP